MVAAFTLLAISGTLAALAIRSIRCIPWPPGSCRIQSRCHLAVKLRAVHPIIALP